MSVDVKNYKLSTPRGRLQLGAGRGGTSNAASARAASRHEQGVIIDIRGQKLDMRFINNMIKRIINKSNGAIAPDDIHLEK
jgi:urocanate hydratase